MILNIRLRIGGTTSGFSKKMYSEKESTMLIRMILSVRDNLDQIENGKISSFHEMRRLEQLNELFTASLFHTLIDEVV